MKEHRTRVLEQNTKLVLGLEHRTEHEKITVLSSLAETPFGSKFHRKPSFALEGNTQEVDQNRIFVM